MSELKEIKNVGLAQEETLGSELTRYAKIKGYDYDAATWRNVRVDADGKLVCTLI